MKIYSFLFFLLLMVFPFGFMLAQEQLPIEKRMFEDPNGKVFINRSLGVYLWISNFPEENSKKQRLFSDSTRKYSNPMYFDTEGYNTFRSPSAIDTVTKRMIYPQQDIIFEVYSDGLAPITNIRAVSGTSMILDGKPCYDGKSKIILKSHDAISGVDKTYYSIDGVNFSEFKDSIAPGNEGNHTLKYYSADNVGNREIIKNFEYSIDNSAPASYYEIMGKTKDGKIGSKATVKLNSKDNISGVKSIYYQINNGPVKVYTTPIPIKLIGENLENLTFYAIDKLNNKEVKKTIDNQ